MRTYIRTVAYGQRLKRYPFCLLERAEAVFDERRSTAGIEQERQKDTSEKRGHVKPVHPCTGLTTRFANSKTCFCLEPPPSMAVVKTLLEL